MPLPRALANIRREISEKKWEEALKWAGERTNGKKYRMPKTQRPNEGVARSPKQLAGRFH